MTLTPYTRNGTTVLVRDNTDRTVLAQVQDEYPWDELIEPGYKIIDIGAHAGYFAVEAHKRWPNAAITCIEPDTDNYNLLRENTKDILFGLALQGYVWYSDGDYALAHHKVHSSGHAVVPASFKSDVYDVMPLKGTRFQLDDLLDARHERGSLLKLDCEGAEKDILMHMTRNDFRRLDCIVGERHGTLEQFGAIYARLRDAGFTVKDTMSAHSQARGIFLARRSNVL